MENKKTRFFNWAAANWDTISIVLKWLFVAIGGSVSGYLAHVTEALKIYAPFSWFLAALLGAALVWLIFASGAWFRAERIRAAFLRNARSSSIDFNPLEDPTQHRRISLIDIIHPTGEAIKNKTFVNCEFVGPGTIIFAGCHVHNLHLGNCEGIKMAGETILNVPNKALFIDCTFRDCKFYNIILAVPNKFYDELKKGLPGLTWL